MSWPAQYVKDLLKRSANGRSGQPHCTSSQAQLRSACLVCSQPRTRPVWAGRSQPATPIGPAQPLRAAATASRRSSRSERWRRGVVAHPVAGSHRAAHVGSPVRCLACSHCCEPHQCSSRGAVQHRARASRGGYARAGRHHSCREPEEIRPGVHGVSQVEAPGEDAWSNEAWQTKRGCGTAHPPGRLDPVWLHSLPGGASSEARSVQRPGSKTGSSDGPMPAAETTARSYRTAHRCGRRRQCAALMPGGAHSVRGAGPSPAGSPNCVEDHGWLWSASPVALTPDVAEPGGERGCPGARHSRKSRSECVNGRLPQPLDRHPGQLTHAKANCTLGRV